ncbi:MAG: hypothetical protein QXZ09_01885 [Candidatus Methanomethylicaceae archaeon]
MSIIAGSPRFMYIFARRRIEACHVYFDGRDLFLLLGGQEISLVNHAVGGVDGYDLPGLYYRCSIYSTNDTRNA